MKSFFKNIVTDIYQETCKNKTKEKGRKKDRLMQGRCLYIIKYKKIPVADEVSDVHTHLPSIVSYALHRGRRIPSAIISSSNVNARKVDRIL